MMRTSQGRAAALSFGILAHIIAAGPAQTTHATRRRDRQWAGPSRIALMKSSSVASANAR
jgi:hypothetical protein